MRKPCYRCGAAPRLKGRAACRGCEDIRRHSEYERKYRKPESGLVRKEGRPARHIRGLGRVKLVDVDASLAVQFGEKTYDREKRIKLAKELFGRYDPTT